MGKLSEFFFRKEVTANVNQRAQKLFPLTYILLSALPIALTVISLFREIIIFKVALLTLTLVFSLYSGIARRQTLFASLIQTEHL